MIAAALGVVGLDAAEALRFVGLLAPLPGRIARAATSGPLVLGQMAPPASQWQPGRSASGRQVLVNGQLHNRLAIAAELGVAPGDAASIYAAAVDRWEHHADERLIGHYCTIAVNALRYGQRR